jgi:hypothetical protein
MAYVYRHIRKDKNEVFYIGIGMNDDGYKRAYSKRNRNHYWNNIINISEYSIDILSDGLTIEQAFEKEIEFISIYGRKDLNLGTLCNLTSGGDGVVNMSPISRKKLVDSNTGKIHSQETKDKIGHIAKNRSPESRMKMRLAKLGKKIIFTDKHRENLRKSGYIKNHPQNILVLNQETGIYYMTAKDASRTLSIRYNEFHKMITNKTKNKTQFKIV